MLYLETHSTDPYYNLAFEEYAFEKMCRQGSCFMLWQNDNAVVVGRYQNTAQEVDRHFVEQQGIRVVRRLSGGGAVYHDLGNLNFTFITDKQPDSSFQNFSLPVLSLLKKLGVPAEFNSRNDLTIEGRKFSGNAQHCRDGRLLHHGTLMLNSNLSILSSVLCPDTQKLLSKGVKSVRSRVTNIASYLLSSLTVEEFGAMLKEEVAKYFGALEPFSPTETDLAEIQKLYEEKYKSWDWNYGQSPAYCVERTKRFSFGSVTIHLQADGGCISDIRIYGDFFGEGQLSDLENALCGLPLNETLGETLKDLNVSRYIHGATAEDIQGILLS